MHYKVLRASPTGFHISSYFTISRSCFINYNILFYNMPNILKLYYFTILLKYYFLIFNYYFSSTLFLFQIQPFQLFQIQLFQRSIFNNLQFFLFSFSISFQLFQQPGCIFFFNFFPTISTTCQFFFFRKNLSNINVLKLANFKNSHTYIFHQTCQILM